MGAAGGPSWLPAAQALAGSHRLLPETSFDRLYTRVRTHTGRHTHTHTQTRKHAHTHMPMLCPPAMHQSEETKGHTERPSRPPTPARMVAAALTCLRPWRSQGLYTTVAGDAQRSWDGQACALGPFQKHLSHQPWAPRVVSPVEYSGLGGPRLNHSHQPITLVYSSVPSPPRLSAAWERPSGAPETERLALRSSACARLCTPAFSAIF